MTFVIISGGIDLSVGSIVALSGVVLGALLQGGQPLAVALAAALAVGHRLRPAQRRARQRGRPAAVHRHARHDERRARRGAGVYRRPAGVRLRRGLPLARHRLARLRAGAGRRDDRGLRRRARRPDAHDVRPLRLRDRRQRRGDAALRRRRALPQDRDLRRLRRDERGCRDRADGAAQLGAADRRHDVRARCDRRDRDRRHQPDGRRGHACRHAGRRADHGRAAQRPEPAWCIVVPPADRDRRRHRGRRAGGHGPQTPQRYEQHAQTDARL